MCKENSKDARRLQISKENYRNHVIDKLTCEIMENEPLGSRMLSFYEFTSGIFSSKTLVSI